MDLRRLGLIVGGIGLAIVVAFLLGGGIETAVYSGIFWVGALLLYLGCGTTLGITTWKVLAAWLLPASLFLLVLGYFRSTSAILVGLIALTIAVVMLWRPQAMPDK